MRVLFVGFPKTGTKTIAEALKILGYKVYDFEEHFYYHGKEWTKILNGDGTKEDFQKMYADVDAPVDGPVYVYWKEILEAFPECKLIVHYRDDQSWCESVKYHNKILLSNVFIKVAACLSPTGFRFARYSRLLSCWLPWQTFQGTNFQIVLKRYQQHNLQLQMEAPKGKLYAIDYKDGWTKLCKFLNKPVPEEPFPHKNKMASVIKEGLDNHPIAYKIKLELFFVFGVLVLVISFILLWKSLSNRALSVLIS